jgi:hypothetical protein
MTVLALVPVFTGSDILLKKTTNAAISRAKLQQNN